MVIKHFLTFAFNNLTTVVVKPVSLTDKIQTKRKCDGVLLLQLQHQICVSDSVLYLGSVLRLKTYDCDIVFQGQSYTRNQVLNQTSTSFRMH